MYPTFFKLRRYTYCLILQFILVLGMEYYQSQIANDVDLSRLTSTELQIIEFIKKGYSSPQIASFRNCSSRTIEKHRSNIIKKLKINSTQNALLIWISRNQNVFTT